MVDGGRSHNEKFNINSTMQWTWKERTNKRVAEKIDNAKIMFITNDNEIMILKLS